MNGISKFIRSSERDSFSNITDRILNLVGKGLQNNPKHPLGILNTRIQNHFKAISSSDGGFRNFDIYSNLPQVVSTEQNFDQLLIPKDHVSRSPHDSYYINKNYMLRTHTSAHQHDLLSKGLDAFLISADVYRRDEIDSSHYPVFHQMEGVRTFRDKSEISRELDTLFRVTSTDNITEKSEKISPTNPLQISHEAKKEEVMLLVRHLKLSLESMMRSLFQEHSEIDFRWVETYFPFTSPSWEMEVLFNGKWLEICGCGIIEHSIMSQAGRVNEIGWAFGLGLERIAMALFGIPDIRLFWSKDERFLSQFKENQVSQFKPFSKYPAVYKDVAFWVPDGGTFHENDFFEFIRTHAGDLVEDVKLIDEFQHPKTKKKSKCYRIMYRSMERTLLNEEVDLIQNKLRSDLTNKMGYKLR